MDRYSIMNKAFEYFRFTKLVSLKMALMGQRLFVRFATRTVRTDYDYTVVNYIDRCRITKSARVGWDIMFDSISFFLFISQDTRFCNITICQ